MPIVRPLFKELDVILSIASLSFSISLMFFLLNSAPFNSSFNNSVRVKPVSIAPINPVIPPAIAPPPVVNTPKGPALKPVAPIAAPPPAPTAVAAITSSEPKDLPMVTIDETSICGKNPGFSANPTIVP